jgi:PAS domain S-box-containing protein
MEIKGIESGKFLPFEKTVFSEVINHIDPLYRPDIKKRQTDFESDKILLEAGLQSDFMVPLIVNDQRLGILTAGSIKTDGIGEEKRFILQLLAARLAQAVQSAIYVDALKENEKKYRALVERAEKEKIAGDQRYRKLVDSVTDYIFTVKVQNGKAVSTKHGPGCIAVTGYSSEEYEADPYLWYRMVHQDDRESVIKHAERVISGEGMHSLEHRIIHKSGDIKWVRNTPVPRHDQEGNLIAYDGLIVDITERKKAEEEKLRLQEQLLQSQKMEAVGLLAGGVAHDFNNILTAIIGYANIVKMKMRTEDPQKNLLDQILRSSERGANLIQSLLAFSRKQLISPKPTDLNIIIRNVQKLLSRVITEDIEMKVVLDERNLTVMADSGQMEQILMNLATNARDAMPNGGALTLRTELTNIEESFIKQYGFGDRGEYALLSVTDSGSGMDEKTKERIFEPFFTTKDVGRGTGLGLAMVYGAIKQNGGFITVDSEPGKGATFNLYLPLIKTEAREGKNSQIVEIIKGGTETILIAEDDESLRELAGSVLKEFGYTVIEAKDGADAIEKFNEHKEKVKLLILDVIMPKKNGKEVFDEIKKSFPDIRVLFVSGYTSEIVHKKGIIDSKLNFLPKPILPNQLLKKVGEILDSEVKKI